MIDVVIPNGNEEEFIKMAEKLGFDSLCFLYSKPTKVSFKSKLKIYSGVICDSLKGFDSDLVVVRNADRAFFESNKGDVAIDLEDQLKDFIHHRSSGLNHVLCALAKEKGKIVAVDFSLILAVSGVERAQILGRVMQNIEFARKYKFGFAVCSFASAPFGMRSPHDLKAFLISLGCHPLEGQKAMISVEEKILHNLKKKSPSYLGEGVELIE